jgi:hypothetical protein
MKDVPWAACKCRPPRQLIKMVNIFYFNLKDKNDIFHISPVTSDILSGTYIPNQNQNNGCYSINPAALGVLPFIERKVIFNNQFDDE